MGSINIFQADLLKSSKCLEIDFMRNWGGGGGGYQINMTDMFKVDAGHVKKWSLWRVGRGREPWERSEAGGVIGNERHLHRSPVSSPTEELRKG